MPKPQSHAMFNEHPFNVVKITPGMFALTVRYRDPDGKLHAVEIMTEELEVDIHEGQERPFTQVYMNKDLIQVDDEHGTVASHKIKVRDVGTPTPVDRTVILPD